MDSRLATLRYAPGMTDQVRGRLTAYDRFIDRSAGGLPDAYPALFWRTMWFRERTLQARGLPAIVGHFFRLLPPGTGFPTRSSSGLMGLDLAILHVKNSLRSK